MHLFRISICYLMCCNITVGVNALYTLLAMIDLLFRSSLNVLLRKGLFDLCNTPRVALGLEWTNTILLR